MRPIRQSNESRGKKHSGISFRRTSSFLVALFLFALPLLSAGCTNTEVGRDDSPWFGRLSTIHYSLSVKSADNQEMDELTLFLPFPRQNGKFDTCMLKGLENWQKRSGKDGGPPTKADFASRNTKYGPMLKVHMTNMLTDGPNYNLSFRGESQYNNPLPVGKPWVDHPFAPVMERDGRKCTWIYVDSPVERKMKMLLTYDASYWDVYYPLEPMGGSGKRWMVGSSFDSDSMGPSFSHSLLIEGRGWIEVPLWTD